MIRLVTCDGESIWLPESWDKFVFRGWVYRVVFGTLVRGEQFEGGDHATDV